LKTEDREKIEIGYEEPFASHWTWKSGIVSEGVKEAYPGEKGISNMLITQEAKSGAPRQGGRSVSLSELRDQLAGPADLTTDSRQRLEELDGRLSRIWALGDEYIRVDFSQQAAAALECCGAVT